MAEMVTRRVASVGALREISGIGEARVEKYGAAFLAALAEALAEAHIVGGGEQPSAVNGHEA